MFADGREQRCDGLLVPVTLHQRSDLAARSGPSRAPGHVAADAVEVDAMFQTAVPAFRRRRPLRSQMPSVANAIAAGSRAAAGIVRSLMA